MIKENAYQLKKWNSAFKKITDNQKKKYVDVDVFEDKKVHYKKDLQLIGHYLFKDFNENVMSKPTAFRIFKNEKMREGFEKGEDPKEIKAKASNDWRMMSNEDKKPYMDLKKGNDNWFAKAAKIRKVTHLEMYV